MTRVTPELLPNHPIIILRAAETNNDLGIMAGEVIAYKCLECRNVDETLSQIVHQEDCRLAGQTKPTAYADRPQSFEADAHACDCDPGRVATDGGPSQKQ